MNRTLTWQFITLAVLQPAAVAFELNITVQKQQNEHHLVSTTEKQKYVSEYAPVLPKPFPSSGAIEIFLEKKGGKKNKSFWDVCFINREGQNVLITHFARSQ